jgi:hypothetical protein
MFKQSLFTPADRGYHIAYEGNGQRCPGCGRSHWLVGRLMAECAFCTTALPIEGSSGGGSPVIVHKNMTRIAEQRREIFTKAA